MGVKACFFGPLEEPILKEALKVLLFNIFTLLDMCFVFESRVCYYHQYYKPICVICAEMFVTVELCIFSLSGFKIFASFVYGTVISLIGQ